MTDVLLRAGVQGGVIDRLEMHGTGTSLGDPIEVGAALEVFASPSSAARHAARPGHALTLEGAKPRAGHCEPGAGVVGMLFAMSHITERTMAPLIHLRELNPHVEAATRRSTRVRESTDTSSASSAKTMDSWLGVRAWRTCDYPAVSIWCEWLCIQAPMRTPSYVEDTAR